MKALKRFLQLRVPNRAVMLVFLAVLGLLFAGMFLPHNDRGSDWGGCILNQRNIQRAVRHYAGAHALEIGDPIDWSKIIGVGQYIERDPVCPVHGTAAYDYAHALPPIGVPAATCKDPAHKPSNTNDW